MVKKAPENVALGRFLHARRTAMRLHHQHLAEALDVSMRTYARMESGERAVRKGEEMVLARALGVSEETLRAARSQPLSAQGNGTGPQDMAGEIHALRDELAAVREGQAALLEAIRSALVDR